LSRKVSTNIANKIGSIAPDAPLKTKAKSSGVVKRALQTDKRAQPELQMFSTAPGKRPAGYTYDEKAGQGVTIYVLDEGFNLRHKVSRRQPDYAVKCLTSFNTGIHCIAWQEEVDLLQGRLW
jgi:hypothetical protein